MSEVWISEPSMFPHAEVELQEKLIKKDWDWLIILDAMRWDFWWKHTKMGKPVRSPASATREWCLYMKNKMDFSDVVCVNANPEVSRRLGKCFRRDIRLWDSDWTYVNGIPTVPPDKVVNRALKLVDRKVRVIVWFLQPHFPAPLHDPPLPVFRAIPHGEIRRVDDRMPAKYILDPRKEIEAGRLTREMIISGYESNIRWVLGELRRLLDNVRGKKIVITADHGEMLGEHGYYGHWDGAEYEELRIVPWVELWPIKN